MPGDSEARGREGSPDPDSGGGAPPTSELWKQPRTVALVVAATLLVLGVPAVLMAASGRWDAVAVLLVLFAGMVYATASWLREAVEVKREMDDE